MQPPPDRRAGELRTLQAAFGRSLLLPQPAAEDLQLLARGAMAAEFAGRFDVYRNNAWQFFLAALERTYPVVQRRVGAEFFRQLAREYRAVHPSRRGDLHWVGEQFPAWLGQRLRDTGYEWLADLARLEWACEEAVTAGHAPPLALAQLARHAPEALAQLQVALQPSLRLVASRYPVWSVWQANQQEGDTGPVDLEQGAEHCVAACSDERVAVYRLQATEFTLLSQLHAGLTLEAALAAADADAEVLGRLLAWAFGERLVVGLGVESRQE